jgi:hypothetical protein
MSESILTLVLELFIWLLNTGLHFFDAFSGLQAFLGIPTLAIR